MAHSFVGVAVAGIFCAFLIAPSLSIGAVSPPPRVLEDENLEAAVEGGIKKLGILEVNRSLAREASDGRECFQMNNETTDCRETQFGSRD